MQRRIRQSGSALRKLIRSLAAAGVAAGWVAKEKVRIPAHNTVGATPQPVYWDRLLIGPASGFQASRFVAVLESAETLVVPMISLLEVLKWVLREHSEAQASKPVTASYVDGGCLNGSGDVIFPGSYRCGSLNDLVRKHT